MNARFRKSVALTCLLVFASVFSSGCAQTKSESIKIGMIAPLTGPNAQGGYEMLEGAKLAIKEVNAAGGIAGVPLELITEDDASVPAQSVSVMEKLVTRDNVVAVIGAFNSSCTLANMKVAEREGVPQLCPISTALEITESGNKWIFRNTPTNPMVIEAFADYVQNEMPHVRKLVICHENTDYGNGIRDALAEKLKRVPGAEIVEVVAYLPRDTDFYSQLTNLKKKEFDAIFLGGDRTEAAQIVRQAKEIDLKVKQWFGLLSLSTYDFDQLCDGLNEGMIVLSAYEPSPITEQARHFNDAFRREYGREPTSQRAATYDAVYIIKKALDNTGIIGDLKRWRSTLRDNIAGLTDYEGVLGPIKFDSTGQSKTQIYVIQWRNHQKVILYPKVSQ